MLKGLTEAYLLNGISRSLAKIYYSVTKTSLQASLLERVLPNNPSGTYLPVHPEITSVMGNMLVHPTFTHRDMTKATEGFLDRADKYKYWSEGMHA